MRSSISGCERELYMNSPKSEPGMVKAWRGLSMHAWRSGAYRVKVDYSYLNNQVGWNRGNILSSLRLGTGVGREFFILPDKPVQI